MTYSEDEKNAQAIIRYHEESKHHYDRYARSAGYMDWDNQPDPFRFYEETQSVNLPLLTTDPDGRYGNLFRRDPHRFSEFCLETIGGFLELSLGLSAWKGAGNSRWALRMNPSSGNLHPTEAHLILPEVPEIPPGLYHYNPLGHKLEQRAKIGLELVKGMWAHFGGNGFLIGLSSIFWRESWKYGERAYRYCNLDVGHALAALSFSANLFGWKISYLSELSDEEMRILMGFDKTRFVFLEEEHPDLLCWVHPHSTGALPRRLPRTLIAAFQDIGTFGRPNRLSKQPVNWKIIYETAKRASKPAADGHQYKVAHRQPYGRDLSLRAAAKIIRQRRSATAFDPGGAITRSQFMAILDKTLPQDGCPPFDVELMEAQVHLLIFVHRVEGLAPGLYFFIRNQQAAAPLRRQAASRFLWAPVENKYPLFLLEKKDYRRTAMMVSCHQEIAGDSVFSLGMIAAFQESIVRKPFCYRQLFWECGMIGQVLYLEAETQGIRGTGIGCFFDDAVHAILGFEDNQYQSLYHFTLGCPVEDSRLTTYSPYYHLNDR